MQIKIIFTPKVLKQDCCFGINSTPGTFNQRKKNFLVCNSRIIKCPIFSSILDCSKSAITDIQGPLTHYIKGYKDQQKVK